MASNVTGDVSVSAQVSGTVVFFTIHTSATNRHEIKTTRFSELDQLHGQLAKEIPSFPARLPAKTLRRRTTPDFIESRRTQIEMYLRSAATHPLAKESTAWNQFFAGSRPPPSASQPQAASQASTQPAAQSAEVTEQAAPKTEPPATDGDGKGEGSEDEADCLSNTLTDEMNVALQAKRKQLSSAKEAKKELEGNLTAGDEAIKKEEMEAQTAAALETEAAARLRSHRLSLEELEANRASKKVQSREKERMNLELAKRYEDKLALTQEAVKKAQTSFENARRQCIEITAKGHASIQAATTSKVAAEAADSAAKDSHSAMVVAMNAIQEKANLRKEEEKQAERELEAAKMALKAVSAEFAEAEALRRKAESEALAADTAITSHISDAARRNRAHEVEVRRAQEKAVHSAALRDMRTRGLLMGQDRDLHEPAENEATAAAEADADALAKANKDMADTKAEDGPALAALKAVALGTAKNKRKRDTIAAALATRVADNEVLVHAASARHSSAVASHKSVNMEFMTVKARVEEHLAPLLPECAAKLEAATKNLAAIKEKCEEERAPLRYAEEAEEQLLKNHQVELDALIQTLDEVHMATAEAHEDAAEPSEETDQGPDFNFLQKSSEARVADREKDAQDAARACQEAAKAVEDAKAQLAEIPENDDDEDADSDGDDQDEDDEVIESRAQERIAIDEQRAALEAVLRDLDHVLQEKKEANKAASAALAAAKQELNTIAEKKKNAPRKVKPMEKLVRDELGIVDSGLAIHTEQGSGILERARQKAADWAKEKEEMAANLHRAELQVQVAEKDVTATKEVANALKAGEKAAKQG